MKRHILTALMAFAFGIGISLLTATPSMAVHKGSGDLTCGSCHTMHSSQGGTSSSSMGSNSGSFILLRGPIGSRAEIHNFCLSCHSEDGAMKDTQFNGTPANTATTPPKVHRSSGSQWTSGSSFATIGAGGEFQGTYSGGVYTPSTENVDLGGAATSTNTAVGRQHSLGATDVTPPGNNTTGGSVGTNSIAVLTCTSCHDPHGTNETKAGINRYRNLKGVGYIPSGAQNSFDFTAWTNVNGNSDLAASPYGGVAGGDNSQGTAIGAGSPNNIWPVWRSTGTQNRYLATDATDKTGGAAADVEVGVSRFCAQCHGAWHEVTNAAGGNSRSGDDWTRHPTQNRIEDATRQSGAGVTITDFAHYSDNAIIPVGYKLPAAQSEVSSTTYYANDVSDRVFCLSCHFAHGSPNFDILRWNYTSAVSPGSQVGNTVASNVGCQQCHNR